MKIYDCKVNHLTNSLGFRMTGAVFSTDDSLLKMLYLAMVDITKNGRDTARTGDSSIPC